MTSRDNGPFGRSGEVEARWLELFGERSSDAQREQQELAAGPFGSEVVRLDEFLSASAEALRTSEAVDEAASRRVAQRVLRRTTRAGSTSIARGGSGRWGDLRVLAEHAGRSLRRSPVLRLAAASLVLHLLALPVLAFFVMRSEPEREAHILFEQWPELPAVVDEVFAEPTVEVVEDPSLLEPVSSPYGSDRELLQARMAPRRAVPVGAGSEGGSGIAWSPRDWIAARTELVRTRQMPVLPSEISDPVVRVLRAELALDGLVLLGRSGEELELALQDLEQVGRAGPVGRLAQFARERAARYGRSVAGPRLAADGGLLGWEWRATLRAAIESTGPVPSDLEVWLR